MDIQRQIHQDINQKAIKLFGYLIDNQTFKSKSELAKAIGVKPQTITEILGQRQNISAAMIHQLINELGVTPEYFYSDIEVSNAFGGRTRHTKPGIPLVGTKAAAGYVNHFQEPEFVTALPEIHLPGPQFHNGTFCAFEVYGDSMHPTLQSGDVVISELPASSSDLPKRNGVYVVVTRDSILVKRLQGPITGNSIELRSDNSSYAAIRLPLEELNQLWFVTYKITDSLERHPTYTPEEVEIMNNRIDLIEVEIQRLKKLR